MAHRITYKPQGIILSSAVGEITVAVEGEYVDVTLTATGGIVILSERYYAHGGYVTLYDLGSLIESEMNKSGQSCADFTLAGLYRLRQQQGGFLCASYPLLRPLHALHGYSHIPQRKLPYDALHASCRSRHDSLPFLLR